MTELTKVLTQIESANKGIITPEMEIVAKDEGLSPEFIMEGVKKGTIVILKNNTRKTVQTRLTNFLKMLLKMQKK